MAGGISVSGISSGLDTSSIISKLIELKRRPLDIYSAKKDLFDLQLTELQTLNTHLLSFQSVADGLSTSDGFLINKASFSNNNALDNNKVTSLTVSSTATPDNFSLVVNYLAKAEKELSQGFASSSSNVSTGFFIIRVGSSVNNITIDSSNNTLSGLRDAINSSGADVTASILNDGNSTDPFRLVVKSKNTGADNTVVLEHIGKFNLGVGLVTDGTVVSFTESQAASDASFTLDGVAITKSSNTVTDVIDGVTVKLESAGSGAITIDVDVDSVKNNIEEFVSEYNELMTFVKDQFFFDDQTGKTGVLFGNNAVLDLQNNMRSIITSQIPGLSDTFATLAQIGISTDSIGLLDIEDGTLTDAINDDIDAVSKLFIGAGSSDTPGLTFVGFTEDTKGGTYRIRVSSGQVQTATEIGSFSDADGSGSYYSGADGTSEDGLRFGLSSLTDGTKGNITFSMGVAAQFSRILDNLTDLSKDGPLKSEFDTLTSDISDLEDIIEDKEARLASEEEILVKQFTALEVFVTRMQSQGDFLAQMSAGLLSSVRK